MTARLRKTAYNPPTMRPSHYDKLDANRAIYNSSWVLEEGWTNRPVTIADKQAYYHQMGMNDNKLNKLLKSLFCTVANNYPKLAESNLYRGRNVSSVPLGDRGTGRDSHRMSDLTSRRCYLKVCTIKS